ncbi:MAG: hypothetical protein SVY53_10965 [Chloroflexota bacterium]|nr:hypothetical protein [Chloroflexota bacterium]
MGYPTDVRAKSQSLNRGYSGEWGASGADIPETTIVDVVPLRSKAGELLAARVLTNRKELILIIELEGAGIARNYRESPNGFMNGYGYCGKHGFWDLAMYDTVNDKYILEFKGPMRFGSSIKVKLENPAGATAKASCDVEWVENT